MFLMFRELVKVSKKLCFIGEKGTFEVGVSSKKSEKSAGPMATVCRGQTAGSH